MVTQATQWSTSLAEFREVWNRSGRQDEYRYGARLSSWAWVGLKPFPTDGWTVVKWIQGHCCYTKGSRAKQPIRLRSWQVAEILEMFRLDPVTGKRKYRRGLLGVPRKNGKSMIGAALALQGLCGDDEYGAEVYSCAGDIAQARVVWREAATMVTFSPELSRILRVNKSTSEIFHDESGSWYKALSAESYTKEGLNPYRVIFDEVHVQPNHDLWNVMTLGSATREQPFVLGITTAGYNKDTLCGWLYDTGRAVEKSHIDPTTYFKWYEAPHTHKDGTEWDWRDPELWATCNPGLGDFILPDGVKDEISNGENAFRRYRLNQWTSSVDAWLDEDAWNELEDEERELQPGENIMIALDGSFNDDSTALMACTYDQFISVVGLWEKIDHLDDDSWKVPIAEVEDKIREACKKYEVMRVLYDPYRWERTAQALAEEGIPMVEFPQSPERMVPATQEFQSAVLRDKSLTHDGNPRLARHVANCCVKITPRGPKITKETKDSPNKIDAAVAAVMAYSQSKHLPEGKWNIW